MSIRQCSISFGAPKIHPASAPLPRSACSSSRHSRWCLSKILAESRHRSLQCWFSRSPSCRSRRWSTFSRSWGSPRPWADLRHLKSCWFSGASRNLAVGRRVGSAFEAFHIFRLHQAMRLTLDYYSTVFVRCLIQEDLRPSEFHLALLEHLCLSAIGYCLPPLIHMLYIFSR